MYLCTWLEVNDEFSDSSSELDLNHESDQDNTESRDDHAETPRIVDVPTSNGAPNATSKFQDGHVGAEVQAKGSCPRASTNTDAATATCLKGRHQGRERYRP